MMRLWIGLLVCVAGCTRSPVAAPGRSPDAALNEVTTPAEPSSAVEPATQDKNAPPALTVGSPAPPLKVKKFLKGDPVTAFESGKVYVVEFWATWCGPCVASMPHVTALQKQYPDVTIIGVNVWEDEDSAAETFLKQNDEKMGYRVARDDIPEGKTASEGAMATTWLQAAEANGIPTAFVVDAQGRIAAITHPMSLEDSLPKIINGTWDLAAAAKEHLDSVLEDRHGEEFQQRLQELLGGGATDETLAGLDALAKEHSSRADQISFMKFQLLAASPDKSDLAIAEGQKLLKAESATPQLLNAVAWAIIDPSRDEPAPAAMKTFALEAAKLADEKAQQKNAQIADTLACALSTTGDMKGAIEAQRRAVSLAEAGGESQDTLKELRERLTEFEKQATPAKPGADKK